MLELREEKRSCASRRPLLAYCQTKSSRLSENSAMRCPVAGLTREVSSFVTSLNVDWPLLRTRRTFSVEQTSSPVVLSNAHVVIVAEPLLLPLPSARAQTSYAAVYTPPPHVMSAGTFVLQGNWNIAPLVVGFVTSAPVQSCTESKAFPSHT